MANVDFAQTKKRRNVKKRKSKTPKARPKKLARKGSKKQLKRRNSKKGGIPKNPKPIPVLFGHIYSNRCGHCINMQSDWDQLCGKVKDVKLRDIGDDYEANVESVNEDYKTDLKYEGFPTIYRLMSHGTPTQYYRGERTTPAMKKWLYS